MAQSMHASLAQLVSRMPGALLLGDAQVTGVSTDSRHVAPGQLFIALRGETFDGHAFLPAIGAQGGAVVAEQLPAGWNQPAIVVPNTLTALGQIGNYWRSQFAIPVIGVTGSNGKTTVKEMIAAILAAAFGEDARLATRGNLNNEIGVPLTLFRLSSAHRAAVIEMGMNHPGEIARLAAIAAPTVAMVNNAQREHQEFMHTVEAVALENGAVLAALPADGIAVYPADDQYTPLWAKLAGERASLTFGFSDDADVRCTHAPSASGSTLQVAAPAELSFTVQLAAAGLHNVRNALAAIACTLAAGVAVDAIVAGLERFAPVSGRLQHKAGMNGLTVIDDSYNANPDSVRAAIDVLAQARGGVNSPRILVLGDMGEVGTQGPEFHQEIAHYAHAAGIERVLVTGDLASWMADIGNTEHFVQFDELLAALDAAVKKSEAAPGGKFDATVLVKGSRFMKMERVVQHLTGTHSTGKEAH